MRTAFIVNIICFFLALFVSLSVHADESASGHLRMGLGLESHVAAEVNPDLYHLDATPMIFQEIQVRQWTWVAEFGAEKSTSRSGGLEIRKRALSAGVWVRYTFNEALPYLAAGVGVNRHQTSQAFEGAMSETVGLQMRMGIGVGWEHLVTKNVLVGAEARAALLQDHREPQLSFLLRTGVQI